MKKESRKIKVGLYGSNGHQISRELENYTKAELIAVADFDLSLLSQNQKKNQEIRNYASLKELLEDRSVELISLCSPRRRDQARDAILCLNAGKHVYAEKPCALTEEDLDEILEAALRNGKEFHEMAGTVLDRPYFSMKKLVGEGVIGEIVQVFAQKSYPYHEDRPQDEDIDGGLICQCGIHAIRMIEHITSLRVKDIYALETKLGNPNKSGGLNMATSMIMTLENGGVASSISNYLNPTGFGKWGNEHVRIFGTKGFIEAVDGGERTRLIVNDKDLGIIDSVEKPKMLLEYYLDMLNGEGSMPFTIEEELHPTRIVIRAKALTL